MVAVLCQGMVVVLVVHVQQWLVCWVGVGVAHAYVVLMVNVLLHMLLLAW
jgi:hypothetical protein